MSNTESNQKDPTIAVVATGAGVAAGAVATSGTAIAAAGTGAAGFSGYVAGLSAILGANIVCETAAAAALSTVIAGPVLGGLVGYGAYRVAKALVNKPQAAAQ